MPDGGSPFLGMLKFMSGWIPKTFKWGKRVRGTRRTLKGITSPPDLILEQDIHKFLDELSGEAFDNSIWSNLRARGGRKLFDFQESPFNKKSVKEWINHTHTRSLLVPLINDALSGSEIDLKQINQLSEYYTEHTGERIENGKAIVELVVSAIKANFESGIPLSQKIILSASRQTNKTIGTSLAQLDNKFDHFINPDETSRLITSDSEALENELERLLERRIAGDPDVIAEIQNVIASFESRYSRSERSLKVRVLEIAGIWLCNSPDNLSKAKKYLERISTEFSNSSVRLEAMIMHSEGKSDEAIRLLEGTQEPWERNTLFHIILNHNGAEKALKWVEQYIDTSMLALPSWGWGKVAVALAMTNRWDDAVDLLKRVRNANLPDWTPLFGALEALLRTGYFIPEEFREKLLDDTWYIGKYILIVEESLQINDSRQLLYMPKLKKGLTNLVSKQLPIPFNSIEQVCLFHTQAQATKARF